jgi:hypothetical protein
MINYASQNSFFIRTNLFYVLEYIFPDLHTIFSPGWQIRYHDSIRVISKAGAVPGSSAAIILMPEQRFGKK